MLEAVSKDPPRTRRRSRPAPGAKLGLDDGERDVLIAAVRSRLHALLAEAAGTEKHDLQHALARDLDELEAVLHKLGASS